MAVGVLIDKLFILVGKEDVGHIDESGICLGKSLADILIAVPVSRLVGIFGQTLGINRNRVGDQHINKRSGIRAALLLEVGSLVVDEFLERLELGLAYQVFAEIVVHNRVEQQIGVCADGNAVTVNSLFRGCVVCNVK